MKQTGSGEVTHSSLDHGTGIPKGATKPTGSLGRHRSPSWHPSSGSALVAPQSCFSSEKPPARDHGCCKFLQEKETVARNGQSLRPRVEKRRQLLTSLTISLTSHVYFHSWLTMWSTEYLQNKFTLLFSHRVPKVHLLRSSLFLPLPQLLPSQHSSAHSFNSLWDYL